MTPWLILVVEFLLLFFTSQKLFSALFASLHRVIRSKRLTVALVSTFFLPGTVVHELAHMIVAGLLFVRVGKMEFVPLFENDHLKLGSVQVEKTDPIRRFLIGVAPVLVGMSIVFVLVMLFVQEIVSINAFPSWFKIGIYALYLYGIFIISNTLFSSRKDIEGALELLIGLALVFIVLNLAGVVSFEYILKQASRGEVVNLVKQANLLLALPVGINVVFYGLYIFFKDRTF